MNKFHILFAVLLLSSSCQSEKPAQIYLGQGIMAGETTTHSTILQARLTASPALVQGDLPGMAGTGIFEVSNYQEFTGEVIRKQVEANAANDFILKSRIDGL